MKNLPSRNTLTAVSRNTRPFLFTCKITNSGWVPSTIRGMRYGLTEVQYHDATTKRQNAIDGQVRSRIGIPFSIQAAGNRRNMQTTVDDTTVTTKRIFTFALRTSSRNSGVVFGRLNVIHVFSPGIENSNREYHCKITSPDIRPKQ